MRLGVDFGTTRTTVAAADRGNYPIVAFSDVDDDVCEYIPSLMALDGDHRVYGFDAVELARQGAPHLRSFKRLISDPAVTSETTVRVDRRDINVLTLLTEFLTYVAHEIRTNSSVSQIPDEEPLEAVIGIPAHAYSAQRFLTLEAFRAAGFTTLAMINEPSAAGFEYTSRHRASLSTNRQQILVYDLGGGTFDASLVSVEGTSHEILGSHGNNLLGGDDFDQVLAQCALAAVGATSVDLSDSDMDDLLEQARDAKEALTPQTRRISLTVGARDVTVPVADFYAHCIDLIDSTVETMKPLLAIDSEGGEELGPHVAGLYVVGGGSQLPHVLRELRRRFGRRVHRSPHTAASTAIGLAIAADPESGFTLREQLSRGVGVFREMQSGQMVSFDPLLDAHLRVSTQDSVSVTRRYRAAHNIGWFRFVEYTATDDQGVPRGDVLPYGELIFPFARELQDMGDALDPHAVSVRRTEDGPLIEEKYTVDRHGIVYVAITDCDTGYTVSQSLGSK